MPKLSGGATRTLGRLGGRVGQGERDLDVREQAQIRMLLGRATDEHQPVFVLQVSFDVHPIEVFDAHGESSVQLSVCSVSIQRSPAGREALP